jgi:hypothetical protein
VTADVAEAWANGKDRLALLAPGPDGQPLRAPTLHRQVHSTRTVPASFRVNDLRLGVAPGTPNQRLHKSRRAESPTNINGFRVGPPGGFEPRTHGLRDKFWPSRL